MWRKFASVEVLEVKSAPERLKSASLAKLGEMNFNDYLTSDGYVYVRVRAISSRTNKNYDSWPAVELEKSYRTFIGKPVFVDHRNDNPKKARGVVVDAELHIEDTKTSALDPYFSSAEVDPLHLPPTWVELLVEIDAKAYPKLAKAIISGEIDSVSMGANVEYTTCSICDNRAEQPSDFCFHIANKGAYYDAYDAQGQKTSKRAYEHCFRFSFFELSFVFDPAEETALALEVKTAGRKIAIGDVGDYDDFEEGDLMTEEEALAGESEPVNNISTQGDEVAWREEQLVRMGFTPERAAELAREVFRPTTDPSFPEGLDYHDLERLIGQGAQPEQAYNIMSNNRNRMTGEHYGSLFCPACESRLYLGTKVSACRHCPWHPGVKTTEWEKPWEKDEKEDDEDDDKDTKDNPDPKDGKKDQGKTARRIKLAIPQSDMIHMPAMVDTLRDDKLCPICGSEYDGNTCDVCGSDEPPEGFREPDLEKAKQVREQLQGQPEGDVPPEGAEMDQIPTGQPGTPPPTGPQGPQLGGPRQRFRPQQPPNFTSHYRVVEGKDDKWIQKAVKRPGQLHKDLGVPEGEKIPEEKLEGALHSDDPKERERAQFAENMKGIGKGKRDSNYRVVQI